MRQMPPLVLRHNLGRKLVSFYFLQCLFFTLQYFLLIYVNCLGVMF